jgi:hypothetical protein
LQGAADAGIYTIERAVHIERHGVPDPVTFAPSRQVSEPGDLDYGPLCRPPV